MMLTLRAIMTVDDQLDDVTRARIWSRLEDRLDARAPQRRWWGWLAVPVACAAVLVIVLARHAEPPRALEAPAGAMLSAPIGPHVHAALVGPARLELGEDAATVRLAAGTLYAEFESGPGRALRVVAPGAVVDVVGTLFAVEAIGDHASCVSVVHGRVRVTTPSRIAYVGAGQRWCTNAAVRQIEPRTRERLIRHEQVLALDAPVSPPPPPPAPPTPAPTPMPMPTPTPTRVAPPAPAVVAAVIRERAPAPEPLPPPPPAPAPEPPKPVVVEPGPPTAEELYRQAEGALARHDLAAADRAFAQLLAQAPDSPLADEALYERAQLAYQRKAWSDARRHLDTLAQLPGTPLAEPGRYLACRIAVEASAGDAASCLTAYRAAYPQSAHDLDVLGLLVQLAHASGGCAAAQAWIDELARRYTSSALARGWLARCPR